MSTTLMTGRATKILLLNPNSSVSMTEGMKVVVDDVELPSSTEVYAYTAPSTAPASINDAEDIEQSRCAVLDDLTTERYDGIVVACYSVHPLVPALQALRGRNCAVTGIFQASVLTALSLVRHFYGGPEQWGIVTTGKFWEQHFIDGVQDFLGCSEDIASFAGVQSTGLNASDFHGGVDPAVVRLKLKDATKRLLDSGGVTVIVMGCAGMAGLELIIREAAMELRGEDFAYSKLHVVDGVRAGIMQVDHMIQNLRLRPGRKL
ncbi:Asp/Glu/hydantoin racemase [Xylaria sp. CBS 124048]|nr:Asp/Glu/hydantoin racemase [Xylaria sp. CBS 124048]